MRYGIRERVCGLEQHAVLSFQPADPKFRPWAETPSTLGCASEGMEIRSQGRVWSFLRLCLPHVAGIGPAMKEDPRRETLQPRENRPNGASSTPDHPRGSSLERFLLGVEGVDLAQRLNLFRNEQQIVEMIHVRVEV